MGKKSSLWLKIKCEQNQQLRQPRITVAASGSRPHTHLGASDRGI